MTLIIDKSFTREQIKASLEKVKKNSKKKGLRKHFGVSKEMTDAVAFQKKVRNEWN